MSALTLRSLLSLSRCSNHCLRNVRYLNTCRVLCQTQVHSQKDPKEKKKFITPITWRVVVVTSIISGGLLLYMRHLQEAKEIHNEKERRRQLGKAAIGGEFELINTEGKTVKSSDFLGKWVLIYFGFTHCPDVCPDELEKLTKVVDTLESQHNMKVQPIFISVDPDRDTPVIIEKYLKEFSDKILGLTGTLEQTAKACKAYRVYFSNGPKDQDDDYIVDHTIIIYLVDPEGFFVDYYGQTHDADRIVNSIMLNKMKYDKVANSA
ncbi:hypothetical protein KM043_012916 [Ampulex compressa]|nr:hypothetical protein KM043_012916 [Ampulex compressa]